MRVDWNQEAQGLSLMEVRDVLRKAAMDGIVTTADIGHQLLTPEERRYASRRARPDGRTRAAAVLAMLAASGLVEAPDTPASRHGGEQRHPGYQLTRTAMSLLRADKTARIPRDKADQAVAELRKAIAATLGDASLMWEVDEIGIYGSYLTDEADLGDVDVAYSLRPRWEEAGGAGPSYDTMRDALERRHPSPGSMRHDMIYAWAEVSVERMLKVKRCIKLTAIKHVRQLGCPILMIHPVQRLDPAAPGWSGEREPAVLREDGGEALAKVERDIAILENGGVEPGTGDALRTQADYDAAIDRAVLSLRPEDAEERLATKEGAIALADGLADAIALIAGRRDEDDLRDALDAGEVFLPSEALPLELGAMMLDRDVPAEAYALLFCTFPVLAAKHGYVPGMQNYNVPHADTNVTIESRRRPSDRAARLEEIMGRAGETIGGNVAAAIVGSDEWDAVQTGPFVEAVHALDATLTRHLGLAARPLADIMLAMRGLTSDPIMWILASMPSRREPDCAKPTTTLPDGIRAIHTAQPLGDADLAAAGWKPGAHRRRATLRDGAAVLGFMPWQVERLSIGYSREPEDEGGVAFIDVSFRDGRRRRVLMSDLDAAAIPSPAPPADAGADGMMPLITANLRIAFTMQTQRHAPRHQPGWTYDITREGRRKYDDDDLGRRRARMRGKPVKAPEPPRLVVTPARIADHQDALSGIFGSSGGASGHLAGAPGPDPVETPRWRSSHEGEPRSRL